MADPSQNFPDGAPVQAGVFELDRTLISRQEMVQRKSAELNGNLNALLARENSLTDDVGKAKARKDLKPEVDSVIEELQKRAHERSVGSFERMLTGITDDVLPDYQGRRQVKLDLYNERNMPALDIYVDHQGNREEITSGAVANVVSTGLRFISLARSSARRLLVLDEADCWIDGVAVQNYFNVVNQLSRDAGIQTIVITHHDLSSFSEDFRIYRITDIASPDGIDARGMDLVSAGRMAPNELNPNHISFISAKNVEAYPGSGIELSPGVTVIQGANQRGKSAWRRMLDAALMADAGESIIRHKNDTAEIAVGFADGRVLEYQRFRKGATKAEFALHSPASWDERLAGASLKSLRDGPIPALHHTVGAKCPEWLPGETGVYEIDGINVQLWGQFSPVFMLDKPASARASLLSIGRESGYLYAMSETYKADLKDDSLVVAKGEKEIAAIRGTTKELQVLPELIGRIDGLQGAALLINEEAKEIKEIAQISAQLSALRERCQAMDEKMACAALLLDAPTIDPTERMASWLADFARATADSLIQANASVPQIPAVEETALARRVLEGIEVSRHLDSLSEKTPQPPEMPAVQATLQVESLLSSLAQARRESSAQPAQPLPGIPDVLATNEAQTIVKGLAQARRDASIEPAALAPMAPPIGDTGDIANLLFSLKAAAQSVLRHEQQLKELQAEMAQIERGMQASADALGGECPVCHSVMTAEMLLGKQVHSHANTHEPVAKMASVVLDMAVSRGIVEMDVDSAQQMTRATAAASVVDSSAAPAPRASRLKFR